MKYIFFSCALLCFSLSGEASNNELYNAQEVKFYELKVRPQMDELKDHLRSFHKSNDLIQAKEFILTKKNTLKEMINELSMKKSDIGNKCQKMLSILEDINDDLFNMTVGYKIKRLEYGKKIALLLGIEKEGYNDVFKAYIAPSDFEHKLKRYSYEEDKEDKEDKDFKYTD